MQKVEKLYAEQIKECPICKANAVEPCQQPEKDNCPREGEKK